MKSQDFLCTDFLELFSQSKNQINSSLCTQCNNEYPILCLKNWQVGQSASMTALPRQTVIAQRKNSKESKQETSDGFHQTREQTTKADSIFIDPCIAANTVRYGGGPRYQAAAPRSKDRLGGILFVTILTPWIVSSE
jgi:hypothetical protein